MRPNELDFLVQLYSDFSMYQLSRPIRTPRSATPMKAASTIGGMS